MCSPLETFWGSGYDHFLGPMLVLKFLKFNILKDMKVYEGIWGRPSHPQYLEGCVPDPCTWGLRPQTPAVASLLDYSVSPVEYPSPFTNEYSLSFHVVHFTCITYHVSLLMSQSSLLISISMWPFTMNIYHMAVVIWHHLVLFHM